MEHFQFTVLMTHICLATALLARLNVMKFTERGFIIVAVMWMISGTVFEAVDRFFS